MRILLVHGLGRTPLSLFGLSSALRRAGHRTQFFGYSPTFESFSRIVSRLTSRLQGLLSAGPVGLIGHSLGGLLLRLALQNVTGLKVRHLVMLGTPNQSPRMARHAWKWLPFRLLARDCGRFLATPDEYKQLGDLRVPHTVIAGTSGPRGRFSPFGSEQNDGLVAVSEAHIGSETTVVELPVFHTTMMDALTVRERILAIMSLR